MAAATLLVAYFVLTYRRAQRIGYDYDSQSSARSNSDENGGRRRRRGLSDVARDAAIGAGLGTMFRSRSRDHSRNPSRAEVVPSRRQSRTNWEEEKYSQYGHDPGRQHGRWTDRVLEIGALAGAATLARRYLGKRQDRRRNHSNRHDNASHGRADSVSDNDNSLARLEEGRLPPPSRQHPLNQPLNAPLGHRRSHSSFSQESYASDDGARIGGRSHRDGLATLGAAGLLRNIFKNRRERKEQRRLEDIRRHEMEEERIARMNSQGRYTGDGFPPGRGGRRGSLTASTNLTGNVDNRPRPGPGLPPPIPTGVMPAPVAGGFAPPPPPPPPSNGVHHGNTIFGANNPVLTGAAPPVQMPPIPPDPQGILHQETSGSEIYYSSGGRPHRRHHPGRDGLVAGAATGGAAAEAIRHQSQNSTGEDSVVSPPVSVKVKMHPDGRHVTLRRLPEQEAAVEREARRRERQGKHHRQPSASSLGGTDGSERWRRTEALERQQAEAMRSQNEVAAEHRPEGLVPPPPPIPSSSISPGTGSVGSPGTYDGNGTEASADYANNRRRRRAERAQARQERQEHRVEFE